METAHRIAAEAVREMTRTVPSIPSVGQFFEMTLEMPGWVIQAPTTVEQFDIDEVEFESFNTLQPQTRQPGLVAATKLPSNTYEKVETTNKDETCPICMELFLEGSIIRELPCKHIFHDNCVLQWFVKDDRCPKCRTSITR
jgi:hypothetical protein